MILCVAEIRSSGPVILELTDGWYSIDAHCDTAMQQLIERNKIFVGVKLVISCAELVSPGPSAPLEKGSDTYLKVKYSSAQITHEQAFLFMLVIIFNIDIHKLYSARTLGLQVRVLFETLAFSNLVSFRSARRRCRISCSG